MANSIDPDSAEPGYTLPLQTVKPTGLDLYCFFFVFFFSI